MTVAVKTFGSINALRESFYEEFTNTVDLPLAQPFGVIISGGGTPLPVYRRVATESPPCNPLCRIIFADDRHVPRSSPDSNYGNSLPMMEALGLDDSSVIGVDPDGDLDTAGAAFDRRLREALTPEFTIPVAYLGLGSDGHTCSLFSLRDAAREDVLGFAVPSQGGFDRVTISRAVLLRAKRLVFLVTGESKGAALSALLHTPDSIPAGVAVNDHPAVEVWTDVVCS